MKLQDSKKLKTEVEDLNGPASDTGQLAMLGAVELLLTTYCRFNNVDDRKRSVSRWHLKAGRLVQWQMCLERDPKASRRLEQPY